MTILSALHSSRIRNRSMGVLHLIAADESCEVSDILALITPSPATANSLQKAAGATIQSDQPEARPEGLPEISGNPEATPTPEPRTTSTPSVQAHIDEPSSIPLAERPTSSPGADGAEDRAPIPDAPKPLPDEEHRPAEAKTSDQGALSSEPGGMQDDTAIHPAAPSKPVRGRPASIRARVSACHAENPTWPPKLIADHLGVTEDSVRACASRNNLTLGTWKDYQASLPESERTEVVRNVPSEPTRRDQVREAHAAHPDFAAKELASHLGIDELNLRAVASQIGIKLPKAKEITSPARVTLADKIRAHVAAHPDATARDVADATGDSLQAIGWAAQKAEITLRKYTAEERSEASRRAVITRSQPNAQEPVDRAGPPTPRSDAPPPPSASAAEAFDDDEPAPRIRKVMKAPTGRFYLRNAAGNFVHQSLQKAPNSTGPLMTSDRKWAWYDTMDRYRGAKKVWPELADMRKEAAAS